MRKVYISVTFVPYLVDLSSTEYEMGDKKNKRKEANPEELKELLKEKEEKLAEYESDLKRLQAEFENYAKRVAKEHQQMVNCASEKVILKLLNVVDDFERAMKQFTIEHKATREGIEMIFKQMKKILEEEKVLPVEAKGCKFDPFRHEVVLSVESDEPENRVLEEFQKGYTMNGKVIRYSKVKIAKPKQNKEQKQERDGGN